MKLSARLKSLFSGTTIADISKRDGTYVSRKVLNADDWYAWGTRHGIPDMVPAADMHVTIIHSTIDVKLPCDTCPTTIYTKGWAGGQFVNMGPDDESLVFVFSDWNLYDRNWAYRDAGAVMTWPTYRPHLTLSNAAKTFELPDAALQDVPDYIILAGEVVGPISAPDPAEQDLGVDGEVEAEEDLIIVIVVEASMKEAAAKALETPPADPCDQMALRDMTRGKVSKAVLKAIAKRDWAPAEIKAAAIAAGGTVVTPPANQSVKKTVERDLVMTVGPIPEEIRKKLPNIIDKFKANEEERIAYGWASVSTVDGEFVKDLQGDTITMKAQRQWAHSLIKGQRNGLLEHEGEPIGEVVEIMCFDADLQKALSIDLGMEGTLTATHYTCEKTWDMVREGNWMHSIAGRVLVELEEGEE